MALTLEDPEVDRLAEVLSERLQTTKTAAIRHALEQTLSAKDLVPATSAAPAVDDDLRRKAFIAKGLAVGRALREKAGSMDPKAADKAFIDSLYEEDADVR